MAERSDVETRVTQIEEQLEELTNADPGLRTKAEEIVRLLMQLYGAGLGRIVEILHKSEGYEILQQLAEDKLIASLLLLHGLHPQDLETRVIEALHRLERGLDPHQLVLEDIADGVARVRVEWNGGGPPPSTLSTAIERVLGACAPDLDGLEIEGVPEPATPLVQIQLASAQMT